MRLQKLPLVILIVFLFLFSGCLTRSATHQASSGLVNIVGSNTFTNPILNYGPDPWVIRKDGFYYYMHTMYNNVTIWKTRKMSELKNASKTVIFIPPASGPNAYNIWAPELHFINNKWYLYYVAGSDTNDFRFQRTFVLENSNSDPTLGNWISRGLLKVPGPDVFTIDPTILTIKKQDYIIWSGIPDSSHFIQNIYIARLKNPLSPEGERVLLSSPTYSWERVGNPLVNEGPEVLVNPKGKIFLIYSASFCGTDNYCLGMLSLRTGGDPLNPSDWTKSKEPVFQQSPANGQYATGHNGFFKSVDGKENWIIYHGNSQPNQGCYITRCPRMQKFTWNTDGSPHFGEPVKINSPIPVPSGE
jgi:GH43 family beta-xylosidase